MAADDAKRPATALRIKVRHADIDSFIDRFAVNVARSGIFIPTRQPKAVGEEIRFEIRLANDLAVLVGQGVVRWTREPDPENPKAVVGMGVALQRVSKESRDVLLRMLEVRKQRGLPDPPGGLPQPPEDEPSKEEGTTQVRAMTPTAPPPTGDDEGKTQIRPIPRRSDAPPSGRSGRQTNPPPSGGVTHDSPTRVGPMPVSNDSPTRIAPVPARPTHVIPRSERSGPVAAPPPEPETQPAVVNPFAAAAAAASQAEIRLPPMDGSAATEPPSDAPANPFSAAAAAAAAVIAAQPEPEAPIEVPPPPRPPSAPALPASRSSRQRPAPADIAAAASASLSAASTVADELDQEIDVSAVVVRARSLATGDLDQELESLSGGVVVEEISVEEVSGRLARELGTAAPSLRKRPRATPNSLPTPSRPGPMRPVVVPDESAPTPMPAPDSDLDAADSSAIAAAAAAAAAVADSASDAAAAADAAADAAAAAASAAAAAAIAATTPPGGPAAHRGAGAASRGRRQLTAPPPPRPKSATAELRADQDRLARERAERERVERDRQRAERERVERERLRIERENQDRERIRREHEERERLRTEREVVERDRQRAEQEANERAREKQRRDLAERDARRRASFSAASENPPVRDPLAALDVSDSGVDVGAEAMDANELKAALTPPPELVRSVPHAQPSPPVHERPKGRTMPPPLPPRAASRTQPPPAETDTTGVAHKSAPPARAQSVEIEIDDDFEIEIDIDSDD